MMISRRREQGREEQWKADVGLTVGELEGGSVRA
eukprot:COSAG04_NODE_17269_length_474_cov_0.816000_2_plen_33_part_01